MNFSTNLIDKLRQGLDLAKGMAALPEQFGFPLPVAVTAGLKVIEGVTSFASNALEKAKSTGVVINSKDQAEIDRLLADLQAENDLLAAKVAAS